MNAKFCSVLVAVVHSGENEHRKFHAFLHALFHATFCVAAPPVTEICFQISWFLSWCNMLLRFLIKMLDMTCEDNDIHTYVRLSVCLPIF